MLNSKISKAVRLALMYGAVSATAFAVNAEESEENIEKIEVTGSSIKGTDLAGALPVNIISAEDIKNTGVTNVGDLVAQIPSMQGFTTPVSSVGGGGTGQATASLRGIGEDYTLVLLNGRRLAPLDSGNSVDLNSIPLAAIERVEVLTDGASALYGSDAIAGVINFILKDEAEESTVSARMDRPKDGAESYNLSFTTGFGDFDRDGFSIVASLSHEKTETLRSKDRDFAKTGFLEFEVDGNSYFQLNGSGNAIPGIAQVFIGERDEEGRPVDGAYTKVFSPYYAENGTCAPDTAANPNGTADGIDCVFDFTSTLEIFPENERTALLLQGDFAITDNIQAFSTLSYTDFTLTSRIAPNPTGARNLGALNGDTANSVLYTKYVEKHLTAEEQAKATEFRAAWRALPGGNRTNQYDNTAINVILGLEGTILNDIDFNTAVVYSKNEREDHVKNGYYNNATFDSTIASGAIDVFALAEDFDKDQASKDAIESVQWRGLWETVETDMLSFDFRASQPLFELPAGEVYVGYGVDYRENSYALILTEAQKNRVANAPANSNGYDLERSQYGVFTEFQVPILEDLSANLALRYDNIGKVKNNDPSDTQSYESNSDTTYKLSLRYNATDNLVLRASYGTGFKVASLRSYAQPLANQGVTGSAYTCPNLGDANREAFCPPGETQYQAFLKGSPTLAPEESEQMSAGFVYSPTTDTTIQVDYWSIEIEGKVEAPDFDYMFDNINLFNDSFQIHTSRADDTQKLLSVEREYMNLGKTETSGIDWKFSFNNELSFGQLKTTLQGTHIIDSQYTAPGVVPFEWESSLGKFGTDEEVVFRNVAQIQNTLTHGDFSHTLRFSYKSSYADDRVLVQRGTIANPVTETVYNKDGVASEQFVLENVQLKIPSYVKTDYKVDYFGFENTVITFGINNLFDKEPPFSLGDPEGHLVGYEGRYYDQLLRTYYLSVDYSF
ncbi:TonB-dependent receptor [Pseudoalteromonas sp. OOF1S-7]|uniref:TonB-dependent receptor n=1 Tax=Pseudoalteromonas sp. OOF1S-7 TaxID=2917757 RepID=UPI001EF4372C|nr:TonB-dependent receptor [Pseudoalteromonas sp. OOF1S-7]MCG7533825.1 TonB-dependent receptor [Pseudoalteromonas sp. OOF1S-7]